MKINILSPLLAVLFLSGCTSNTAPSSLPDQFGTKSGPAANIVKSVCLGGTKDDTVVSLAGMHPVSSGMKTTDGGYILTGATKSSDGDVSTNAHDGHELWVVKLDADMKIQWEKTLGGSKDEYGVDVAQTKDGGYLVVGLTRSSDGHVSSHHVFKANENASPTFFEDAWVIKLDKDGNVLWEKCYGGSFHDEAGAILELSDGSFMLAGRALSFDGHLTQNHGSGDAWVAKISATGDVIWSNTYGGRARDWASNLVQLSDGGFLVVGYTESTDFDLEGCGNHGDGDIWLLRLDADGKKVWSRCYGGSKHDNGVSITAASNGKYLILGNTKSKDGDIKGNNGGTDVWLAQVNDNGTIIWSKNYGGTKADLAHNLEELSNGDLAIVGTTNSLNGDVWNGNNGNNDAWFFVVDSKGTIKLSKGYGGSKNDTALNAIEESPGMYSFIGVTDSTDGDVSGNHGMNDIWLVRLSQ